MALELSHATGVSSAEATSAAPHSAGSAVPSENAAFLDPAFISQLLGSVDVDQNDPAIQAALAQMGVLPPKDDEEGKSPENKKRKDEDEHK